jgi:RimJ/RimL family protein N-acetyltransferase
MIIETQRLVLRPVSADDTQEIAQVVFSDPNVVRMLAHNTSDPKAVQLAAKRWTKIMGIDGDGGIWDDGGLGLFAVVPKEANGRLAGVAGFFMERNSSNMWVGEYFYALGSAWHGKGLMGEVADSLGEKLRGLPDLGVIYAIYWDLINEASGRLLTRTGLVQRGRKLVTVEYDAAHCRTMFEYDLWTVGAAKPGRERNNALLCACRRAGTFVAENVIEREDAIRALSERYGSETLPSDAVDIFDKALALQGIPYFELRGDNGVGQVEMRRW